MAMLDKSVKQRMVGALVLVAIAVIFLPMLFTRQDEVRHVRVEAPTPPQPPAMAQVQVDPVSVPTQQPLPQEPTTVDTAPTQSAPQPVAPQVVQSAPQSNKPPAMPITPSPGRAASPAQQSAKAATPVAPPASQPAQAPAAQASASRLDANGLSVSWSVQLASLSNRANADSLQKNLRTQGYNAYIRTADGINRVYVGPLVERAEADRMRDQLEKQQKLKGIVVRFQPERG